MRELTVLVVADTLSVTEALLLVCGRGGGITVLGPVPDALAAADALASTRVDAAIVDLGRRDGLGIDVLGRLHELAPDLRLLAVSSGAGPGEAAGVLERGGVGLLPFPTECRAVRDAVERAVQGELVLPEAELAQVVQLLQQTRWRTSEAARYSSLTSREQQVVGLLAAGCGTGEIAARLSISAQTVQSHVKNVLAKLGVHSKVEAVRVAWRCGAVAVPA